jgi:NAD(P) transhydrogenase subunit alpha
MDTVIWFAQLYIAVLAGFVGYQMIARVPPLLHTPLMAATNAIDAITVVGAMVLAGRGHGWLATTLGTIAVASAMSNVVGGFLITDRMLAMFRRDASGGAPGKTAAASNGRRMH